METNLLKAICNIKQLSKFEMSSDLDMDANRITQEGKALEVFVKDAFSNSFDKTNTEKKKICHPKYFSYLGSKNNPPDAMLKNGDAIEVKKREGYGAIPLNSSYPKNKLFTHDTRISQHCRDCEEWSQKDILYVFGVVPKKKGLTSIALIYGDCFAADEEVYINAKNRLSDALGDLPEVSLDTNEIAQVYDVDPLEVTSLRVRGMWNLKNPFKIFDDIFKFNPNNQSFALLALMHKSKFNSFPKEDQEAIINDDDIHYEEVTILDPNNIANLIDSVYIRFDVYE